MWSWRNATPALTDLRAAPACQPADQVKRAALDRQPFKYSRPHRDPLADAFREAERLAAAHTETLGVRSFDLLHVGMAVALGATEFLTFDTRQAALAKAAGLKVKP